MPARLKFNIFSPLPPVRSEIANVTRLVAMALHPLADVTVWTSQKEPPEMPADIPVKQFDAYDVPWSLLQDADLNIYNIGNNASFHRVIFDVARQSPGLIILHDTRLQHFFARYSETAGPDREFYLESMQRAHGPDAVAAAEAFLSAELQLDALVDRYPMTTTALEGALAAILHNDTELADLSEQTGAPVFYLPLPYVGPGPGASRAPDGILRLIVFGHIGLNRRLESILDALAGHPDKAIHLDIYGVMEAPEEIAARTRRLRLTQRVHRHGFVTDEALTAALARADLALNLRFPSMGEASASQLRIWDAGLAALVTRTGWYAGLPDDTVFFVDPNDEVASIRMHLTSLRADPARFRQAGLQGRAVLLRRHSPEAYARGLLEIGRQSSRLHARRQAVSMSRFASHALMEMTNLAGVGSCADPVAEAIRSLTHATEPVANADA